MSILLRRCAHHGLSRLCILLGPVLGFGLIAAYGPSLLLSLRVMRSLSWLLALVWLESRLLSDTALQLDDTIYAINYTSLS